MIVILSLNYVNIEYMENNTVFHFIPVLIDLLFVVLLDYVHFDVFGPVNVPSLLESRYYVSFIDNYSRRPIVYFLKSKSKVFSRFKESKNLVENQTCRKIKCLRIENGSELCSTNFEQYCKDHGIKNHKTTPYTPQQNGVVERLNRTLMEKVRSMLSGAGLEKKL